MTASSVHWTRKGSSTACIVEADRGESAPEEERHATLVEARRRPGRAGRAADYRLRSNVERQRAGEAGRECPGGRRARGAGGAEQRPGAGGPAAEGASGVDVGHGSGAAAAGGARGGPVRAVRAGRQRGATGRG